jgi:phage repressor protein C with HTH and peptisase S24 domain
MTVHTEPRANLMVSPAALEDFREGSHGRTLAKCFQSGNSLSLSGYRYVFAMDTIGARLKHARLQKGYESASSAARAFGWHKQNVADHEADRRGVDADQAKTYGRAYSVDPSWILFGGPTKRPKASGLVPIIGKVGADPEGTILFATGQTSGDLVPAPAGHTDRAAAVEVSGHSMHGFADDGSLLFFEDQHTKPTRDHIGRVVVVELETGEVLVKRLLRGDEKDRWDLESISGPTRHNVSINWVASITAIILPPKSRELIVRAGTAAA